MDSPDTAPQQTEHRESSYPQEFPPVVLPVMTRFFDYLQTLQTPPTDYRAIYTDFSLNGGFPDNLDRIDEALFYTDRTKKVDTNLRALQTSQSNISPKNDPGYINWQINGGISDDQPNDVGRFYINFQPQHAPYLFNEIVLHLAKQSGVKAELKMIERPQDIVANPADRKPTLNRSDKIVLYFNAANQKEIIATLEHFYSKYSPYFIDQIPAFAAPITDSSGQRMNGIAFGQEPVIPPEVDTKGARSFSTVRAEILTEMVNNPGFFHPGTVEPIVNLPDEGWRRGFVKKFNTLCKIRNINPENPAFNFDSQNFAVIQSRIAQS